jgi:hypothetical protein
MWGNSVKILSTDILDLLIRRRIAENKPTNIDQFHLCVYQAVCGTSCWNSDVPPSHDSARASCAMVLAYWEIGKILVDEGWTQYWERFTYWKNYLEIAPRYLNLDQLPYQL